jgi:hypothetical protein
MIKRFAPTWVAAISFAALALLATPAVAQDAEYPPPPPPDDQQDPGQPPPEVDYGRPVEPPPAPPSTALQCAPCEQRQSPAVAHHGLLLMGFVGLNMFAGKGILDDSSGGLSLSLGPGLRLGGLIGVHATPWISVNGELTVDFMNTDDMYGYWVTGGRRFVLALSPLAHLAASSSGNIEVAVGPKLGMRFLSMTSHSSATFSARGYLVGLNAGVFVRGGTVMLGGLVSFELSRTSEACNDNYCGIDTTSVPFERVASVSGSVLF